MNDKEITGVIDELVYRSYFYNRVRRPDIPAKHWATIFKDGEALEKRYQAEVGHKINS